MGFLKPVRKQRVIDTQAKVNNRIKQYCIKVSKVKKPITMKRYLQLIQSHKNRSEGTRNNKSMPERTKDPLWWALNSDLMFKYAHGGVTITKEYIPRKNDYSGVVQAEDLAEMQALEGHEGNIDWNPFRRSK